MQKTALVTGAAGGVGEQIVKACLARGWRVVAVDRDADALDRLPADERLMPVAADVTAVEEVERAIAVAEGVDVLFNNAGVMDGLGRVDETEPADWDRLLAVNLTGAFNFCRLAIPAMRERGEGAIVNVASIAGVRGGRAGAAYTASKYGLVGLTLNIAATYGAEGIRCNAVCPGPIATDMTHGIEVLPHAVERRRRDADDRPAPLPPEEVADAALFLAGEGSRHLNGVVMPLDGGWTAF
jgi:NAD(P)-dependent dehydrogenase (short-subunit alcohol dehydrogenase family)